MKKLECIIRPHKLDEVREALDKVDVHGMTVTEVLGFGRQTGHAGHYRGVECKADFSPKLKLELVWKNDDRSPVLSRFIQIVSALAPSRG